MIDITVSNSARFRRKVRLAVAVLLALALLVITGNSSSYSAYASRSRLRTSFCSGAPVRDFERPFALMRPDHPIPKSGELPFGPHIGVYSLARPLVVGRGIFGFGFSAETRHEQPRPLGWTLHLTLERIDSQGKVVRIEDVVTRHARDVTDLSRMRLELQLGGRPALYRTRLSIKNSDGKGLGTYTQYVRVVPPVASGNLKLDKNVAYPGDEIALRVDNIGTVPIGAGSGYRVEWFDGEQWQTIVEESTDRARRRLRVLFAGESSSCEYLLLTDDLNQGQYRLSKEVQWRSGKRRRLSSQFVLRS